MVERPSQEIYTLRLTKAELSWIYLTMRQEHGKGDSLVMKLGEELRKEKDQI